MKKEPLSHTMLFGDLNKSHEGLRAVLIEYDLDNSPMKGNECEDCRKALEGKEGFIKDYSHKATGDDDFYGVLIFPMSVIETVDNPIIQDVAKGFKAFNEDFEMAAPPTSKIKVFFD